MLSSTNTNTTQRKYCAIINASPYPFPNDGSFNFRDLECSYINGSVSDFLKTQDEVKHWQEWLGSLMWDEMIGKNRFILVTDCLTKTPDNLDLENTRLKSDSYNILRILPLVSTHAPPHNHFICITGKGLRNGTSLLFEDIREIARYEPWVRPFYWTDKEFLGLKQSFESLPSFFESWNKIALLCKALIFDSPDRLQLVESYRSFEASFYKVSNLEFKIPNLVRTIECLIGLSRKDGANEFVRRTLNLVGTPNPIEPYNMSSELEFYLKNLYQLRSDCVHGKPFAWSLKKELGTRFTDNTVASYEYVAEWAARRSLLNALENNKLLEVCHDRDALEQYWTK